jgi:hypothetical protein
MCIAMNAMGIFCLLTLYHFNAFFEPKHMGTHISISKSFPVSFHMYIETVHPDKK